LRITSTSPWPGWRQSARTRTTKSNTLMSYIVSWRTTPAPWSSSPSPVRWTTGGAYVKENAPIIVKGRISVRDEKEPQIMADSIRPLSDARRARHLRAPPRQPKLWVKLPSESDPAMARIKLILEMFPGTGQMIIYCADSKKRIGASCVIHDALVAELEEMLGDGNVVVK
jgi:DNA polymerase-3 subunit alpha